MAWVIVAWNVESIVKMTCEPPAPYDRLDDFLASKVFGPFESESECSDYAKRYVQFTRYEYKELKPPSYEIASRDDRGLDSCGRE